MWSLHTTKHIPGGNIVKCLMGLGEEDDKDIQAIAEEIYNSIKTQAHNHDSI
jgi:hypothetical protein